MSKFVCLKLQVVEGRSAADVINAHIQKAQETKGAVFYSTNVALSPRQGNLDGALLCFQSQPGHFSYALADIDEVLRGERDLFVPEDSALYSPAEYATQPKRTWLRLRNFRRADSGFIASLRARRSNGEIVPLSDILSDSPRLNRIYCWPEGDNDGLVF